MTDNDVQFASRAQQAGRSIYETMHGLAETQVAILQRLGGIQQGAFNQAVEATNDQLQLISRVKDPREYAAAQAELVKNHGQRYADSVKEAVEVVADAWQEYSDRLERGANAVADKAQRASSSRKAA